MLRHPAYTGNLVAFLGLAVRCFYLQYHLADRFAEKSLIQQRAYLPLTPQRGAILDCRGRVLAASNQIRTIFAEPRIIKDPKDTATQLAAILDSIRFTQPQGDQ